MYTELAKLAVAIYSRDDTVLGGGRRACRSV